MPGPDDLGAGEFQVLSKLRLGTQSSDQTGAKHVACFEIAREMEPANQPRMAVIAHAAHDLAAAIGGEFGQDQAQVIPSVECPPG